MFHFIFHTKALEMNGQRMDSMLRKARKALKGNGIGQHAF